MTDDLDALRDAVSQQRAESALGVVQKARETITRGRGPDVAGALIIRYERDGYFSVASPAGTVYGRNDWNIDTEGQVIWWYRRLPRRNILSRALHSISGRRAWTTLLGGA